MTIASEILKAQNNLKDCYDVCKSVDGVVLPDDKNFDNLPALIEQALNPFNKPADWTDIRTDCPVNSIALYAGHTADYSQYDNLGFSAACTGGYNVFIDGTQYGSTYASGAQCNITWSTSGITTGDDITTPTALKAHKIWIEPATSGNNITEFRCRRVAASGTEQQGVLWAHFNLTNAITISRLFAIETAQRNVLVKALTAKNNLITYQTNSQYHSGFYNSFCFCSNLEYLPLFKAENIQYPASFYRAFDSVPVKKVVIKNNNGGETFGILNRTQVEEFSIENGLTLSSAISDYGDAHEATKLKKFPKINQNKAENFQMYNCPALEPVNIDDRFNDTRKVFRFYGTQSVPTPALKSLRVSDEAPFDYETPPQINVNYTGMDRNALVQLFNDLPYNVGYTVVGSPTINNGVVSGFSNSDYLTINGQGQTDFEVCVSFTTSSTITQQQIIWGQSGTGGVQILSDGSMKFSLDSVHNVGTEAILSYILSPQTKYKFVAIKKNDKTMLLSLYNEANELLDTASAISFYDRVGFNSILGKNTGTSYYFRGSIDLNNTYIKVNDVYWFRGQAAMTKTLSCVGATGTADLTAEDKDIALNKGWSLTLS